MEQFAGPSTGFAQQTREHSSSVWEGLRNQITQLHSVQGKPLGEVMSIIEEEHGFVASVRQYKIKISEWHVGKNIKGTEYEFIAQTQAKRALEDKETNFRVRGRDVPAEKIARAVKRQKISEEELIARPSAPTPSDISYGTPSAFDPQSPYVQQTVAQSPGPTFASSPNQLVPPSSWNASEVQNRAVFLVSPGYQPATPLPVVWQMPSNPLESAVFQTPPGTFQSPDNGWSAVPIDRFIGGGDAVTGGSVMGRIKYERLVELIRKTEEIQSLNCMEMMSEINSLVYDLVASDQQTSQVIGQEASASTATCYVCTALEEIGTYDMAAKVESERILLEAIAVSEGCFGEEHRGALHFRVKLFFLYDDWSCRTDECGGLLLQILLQATRNAPTLPASEILSNMFDLPDDDESTECAWLNNSSWGPFFGNSSDRLARLSVQDFRIQDSPRKIWEVISTVAGQVTTMGENALKPFLDSILHQGADSADGPLYFWMAAFIAALKRKWGAIYDSKMLIMNAIGVDSPGSSSIKLSLEHFCKKPYRVVQSTVIQINAEAGSGNTPVSSLPTLEPTHDKMSKTHQGSLEELRLALAATSLGEVEKFDNTDIFQDLSNLTSVCGMHNVLCRATEFGNSTLITKLGQRFGKSTFDGYCSFTDILNHCGEVVNYEFGELPLHLAVSGGHLLTVEALLIAGADPESLNADGDSAIILAAESGHDKIVQLLTKRGAEVPSDYLVLRCIIQSSYRDSQLREKLLQSLRHHDGANPSLLSVILLGRLQRYELLDDISEIIREKVDLIRQKEESLVGPVLLLILHLNGSEVWDELLDPADDDGRGLELFLDVLTGVHIEQQAREIMKMVLFSSAATMNEIRLTAETSESPPLHKLVFTNAINALGVFLGLRPNLTLIDGKGNTALHVAANWNRVACARLLLKCEMDVDVVNNDGETALQVALRKGYTGVSNEIILTLPLSVELDGDA